MATLKMASLRQLISVWEVVWFNMVDSTSQLTSFKRLSAM